MVRSLVLSLLDRWEITFFFKLSGTVKTLTCWGGTTLGVESFRLSDFIVRALRGICNCLVLEPFSLFFNHLFDSVLVAIFRVRLIISLHPAIKILLLFWVSLLIFEQLLLCDLPSILHFFRSLLSQFDLLLVSSSSDSLKVLVFSLPGESWRSYIVSRHCWFCLRVWIGWLLS